MTRVACHGIAKHISGLQRLHSPRSRKLHTCLSAVLLLARSRLRGELSDGDLHTFRQISYLPTRGVCFLRKGRRSRESRDVVDVQTIIREDLGDCTHVHSLVVSEDIRFLSSIFSRACRQCRTKQFTVLHAPFKRASSHLARWQQQHSASLNQ